MRGDVGQEEGLGVSRAAKRDAGVFADGARMPSTPTTQLAAMVAPSAKVAVARASVWVRPVRRVGRWTGTPRSVSLRSSTASVVAWDTIRV